MEFTEAEKQVLIAVKMCSRREAPRRELLDERMELLFAEKLLDWKTALESLLEKSSLHETSDGLTLDGKIDELASTLYLEWSAEGFSDWMLKSEASAAYSEYCKRLYGKDLCQCNMVNMSQMEKLLEVLSLGPGNRVLDLGCGIGTITEYISDQTDANITGVDFAAGAIKRAQERARAKSAHLAFEVQDMDRLEFSPQSFDTILAIDTFYFVFDLSRTMATCKKLLKAGGQMGIFYTQVITPEEPKDTLEADRTKLAVALQENKLKYRAWDFTEDEHRHWRLGKDLAEDLKAEFEQEGNFELYEGRIKESTQLLKAVDEGRISRYLYHVQLL